MLYMKHHIEASPFAFLLNPPANATELEKIIAVTTLPIMVEIAVLFICCLSIQKSLIVSKFTFYFDVVCSTATAVPFDEILCRVLIYKDLIFNYNDL